MKFLMLPLWMLLTKRLFRTAPPSPLLSVKTLEIVLLRRTPCRKMSSVIRLSRRLLRPSSSIRALRRYSLPASAEKEEPFDQRKLPADYDPANFDPAQHRSPPSDRVWRLVDDVSSLTLAEVSELSTILMRKLQMKDPPVVVLMGSGPGGASFASEGKGGAADAKEEKKAEKTVFELRLDSYEAASKIKVIKEVRGFTSLGLKEAKDLVEKTPIVIKGGVSKEEGEQIIEKMKAVGAKVVME